MKERKMRRYQNLLTVSGLGVIIFGLWSVLKTILLLFMKEGILSEIPDDTFVRVMFFLILRKEEGLRVCRHRHIDGACFSGVSCADLF